jgi:hypothetical protein
MSTATPAECVLKCVFSAFCRGGHLFRWVQQRVVPARPRGIGCPRGEFPVPVAPCPALALNVPTSKLVTQAVRSAAIWSPSSELHRDLDPLHGLEFRGSVIFIWRKIPELLAPDHGIGRASRLGHRNEADCSIYQVDEKGKTWVSVHPEHISSPSAIYISPPSNSKSIKLDPCIKYNPLERSEQRSYKAKLRKISQSQRDNQTAPIHSHPQFYSS